MERFRSALFVDKRWGNLSTSHPADSKDLPKEDPLADPQSLPKARYAICAVEPILPDNPASIAAWRQRFRPWH